jgi:hypothetical protein
MLGPVDDSLAFRIDGKGRSRAACMAVDEPGVGKQRKFGLWEVVSLDEMLCPKMPCLRPPAR